MRQSQDDFGASDETPVNSSAGPSADHSLTAPVNRLEEAATDGNLKIEPEGYIERSGSSGFGLVKGIMWGAAFVVTAAASATIGAVVGFTAPESEAIAPAEESPTSITDLWRKGIRHEVARPINILIMGIDQASSKEQLGQNESRGRGRDTFPGLGDSSTAIAPHYSEAQPADPPIGSTLDQFGLEGTRAVNVSTNVRDDEEDDLDQFVGRSDTMLLLQVNPDTHTVNVLSIPRDTQVEFPNRRGLTKINHANLMGGPWLAAKVVSHNLNGVAIDRYVRVDTSAFRDLVDALGGVEVVVPYPMKYTDRTQGLYIDLEEGRQILGGDEAEQFARFRSDGNGDIGRVQRQQQLIRALRDRIMTPTVVPRIPQVLQLLRDHIDTNLTPEELLALLNFGLDLERDDFRMVMLPGTFSRADEYIASYWLMDKPAVDQVMRDYFQVRPPRLVSQLNLDRQEEDLLKSLRIAIQNASDDPSATYSLAQKLRSAGFTRVYRVRSWSKAQLETEIIVQGGNLNGAKLVEDALGQGIIVPASIGVIDSDITVRIGNNWQDWEDPLEVRSR